jgi:hypothetical protein
VVRPTQPYDGAQGWVGPTTEHLPGSIQSKACLDRARHASTETKRANRKRHEAHSQKVFVGGPLRDPRVATRRTRGRHIRCGADALRRVERVRGCPKGCEGCIRCVTPSETHLARGRRVWRFKDASGAAQTLCDTLDAWEHVGRGVGATRHIERAKSTSDTSQMYCDAPGGLQGREGKVRGECLRE